MTELTPAEVLVIEQEAKPDRHYDSGAEGYEAGYLAAALPRELLLKQEREEKKELIKRLDHLTRDCMASDFNEHWSSYKDAINSLTQYKAK